MILRLECTICCRGAAGRVDIAIVVPVMPGVQGIEARFCVLKQQAFRPASHSSSVLLYRHTLEWAPKPHSNYLYYAPPGMWKLGPRQIQPLTSASYPRRTVRGLFVLKTLNGKPGTHGRISTHPTMALLAARCGLIQVMVRW